MFKKLIIIVCFWSIGLLVNAQTSIHTFASDADQARFKQLTVELRCPKCQNQDLADSNAPIAADLRNQIIVMIEQGKSNQEIVAYMVDRYGEFVLYKPRFDGYNVILWLAPVLFVCIGFIVVLVIVRANKKITLSLPLDDEEKQRQLEKLLTQQDKA